MIRRILVPLDGSARAERVLPHVHSVAAAFESRVELMHVLFDRDSHGPEALSDPLRSRLVQADRARYLEATAATLREAGIEVRTRVEEGPAAEVVVELLKRGDHDLVALTPHGAGNSPHLRMGSTALAVIMSTPTSILLVPESGSTEGSGQILAPVDCSPRSEWALCAAAAIASSCGRVLRVVHILDHPEILERLPGGGDVDGVVQTILRKNRQEAIRYLDDIAQRLARKALTIRCEVIEDGRSPARAIQELATSNDVDLIVISAHGHGAAVEWPFGGIAAKLVFWARHPVLLLQDLPSRRPPPGLVQRSRRAVAPETT